MKARFFLLLLPAFVTGSCDVAPSELDGLSPRNAEAYVILRDQLDQMPERLGSRSAMPTFCVTVRTVDGQSNSDPDPTLITRLQNYAPQALNAMLVPTSECRETATGWQAHNGEEAFVLSALFGLADRGEWFAGYGCGVTCGQGNTYTIYHIFGYPFAFRSATWIG